VERRRITVLRKRCYTRKFPTRTLIFRLNTQHKYRNKGKDHNSQTQQYFIKLLKYISNNMGSCFDSHRVTFRPSKCRSRHKTFTALWDPQRWQNKRCALYIQSKNKTLRCFVLFLFLFCMYNAHLLFCKRWGSHNAVNVCMSGSTLWGPEDDSMWVETWAHIVTNIF